VRRSAGILVFRRTPTGPEFLLGHHGGPFWARKDDGAWTIPKGLVEPDEDEKTAARREFGEETGLGLDVPLQALQPLRVQGKTLYIWLAEADLNLTTFASNVFEMEWPPRSGRMIMIPELDRLAYFEAGAARRAIAKGQRPLLETAIARFT